MVCAKLERLINRGDGSDPLIKCVNRFIDHRHKDAIYDESREIFGRGSGFVQTLNHAKAGIVCRLICRNTTDEFDQLH